MIEINLRYLFIMYIFQSGIHQGIPSQVILGDLCGFWKFLKALVNIILFPREFCGIFTEAVAWRCSVEKVFLEISQDSQENTCARVSFLVKFHALGAFRTYSEPSTAWKVSKYGDFSGPYFPAFGLNTERYKVSPRIHSECWKIRTRKNSVFG